MKGISAIIATILLLLIVVAIVGFTFGFFQNLFTSSSAAASSQVNTTTSGVSKAIRIDNFQKGSVTTPIALAVRNLGATAISSSDLQIYRSDGVAAPAGTWSGSPAQPNGVMTFTASANGACVSGVTYKVSGPTNSDEETC